MRRNPCLDKEAEEVKNEAHREPDWALLLGVRREEEEAEEGIKRNAGLEGRWRSTGLVRHQYEKGEMK